MATPNPVLAAAITLPLGCACGTFRGTYAALPHRGSRLVCYCDDCQAYARFLARHDLLDAFGGTEVVQSWPAQIRLVEGVDTIRLLRLTGKGLHRWYTGCCSTPIANSSGSPWFPFAGVVRRALRVDDSALDALYGPAAGVQGRFAKGGCPPGAHVSASVGTAWNAVGLLARGAWMGAGRPNPFFGADGARIVEARVLTRPERDALR